MNDLIDGYRDGGWERGGGRLWSHKKCLSILCKALVSLVEMCSMKKAGLLAVAEQDWQMVCVEHNTRRLGDNRCPHVLPSSS